MSITYDPDMCDLYDYQQHRMSYNPFDDDQSNGVEFNELTLRKQLDESKFTQDEELILNNIKMEKLPEELKEFTWVKNIYLQKCGLTSLENLPPNIEALDAESNKLIEINSDHLPPKLERANFSDNMLMTVGKLLDTITDIGFRDNNLDENSFVNMPEDLEHIILDKNRFTTLPNIKFGSKIKKLDIANNRLTSIDELPNTIEELDFSRNEVTSVKHLPSSIKTVNGDHNKIKYVLSLPESLEYLDLSDNNLMFVPRLPNGIKTVDLSSNNIKYMISKTLPTELKILDLKNNPELHNIPDEISKDMRLIFDIDNKSEDFMNLMRVGKRFERIEAPTKPHEYSVENPYYIVLTKHKVI